jgi:hypothetical protein
MSRLINSVAIAMAQRRAFPSARRRKEGAESVTGGERSSQLLQFIAVMTVRTSGRLRDEGSTRED